MIIVFEGGDQAGKKTQSHLLAKKLKKLKIKTKVFSFPDYSTPIGKEIRKYLNGKRKFSRQVIHCLLAANRWENFKKIQNAQLKNSILIMNRYYQSNLVYGIANGLNVKWLENLDNGLPKADLVFVLDISHEDSFDRKKLKRDQFEKNRKFLQKIKRIYINLAKKKKWKIINASRSKQKVHEEIMQVFAKKLGL